MAFSPLDSNSLTDAQHEKMTDDLESLLCSYNNFHRIRADKTNDVAFIYPNDPAGTHVAVNTLEQLIDLSIFLGSHNMLFDGSQGRYDFYPAGEIDDEDRLELYVYNYAPIPAAIAIHPAMQWIITYADEQGIQNYNDGDGDGDERHFITRGPKSRDQALQLITMALSTPFCHVSAEYYDSQAYSLPSCLIKITHAIGV